MLVGLATLISILFFGGVSENFLVDRLEKGVKKHVVDKERSKELLADLKTSKKFIKNFNKKRKEQANVFKKMNADRETTIDEMNAFFDLLIKEREEFQEQIIADRVRLAKKIEDDEWTLMLAISDESVEKRKAKQKKKKDKGKTPELFAKTKKVINENINDQRKKESVLSALNLFVESLENSVIEIEAMNVKDNNVIVNKEATAEELNELALQMNGLREAAYAELIKFHFSALKNTDQEVWKSVIKSFNKELCISSH